MQVGTASSQEPLKAELEGNDMVEEEKGEIQRHEPDSRHRGAHGCSQATWKAREQCKRPLRAQISPLRQTAQKRSPRTSSCKEVTLASNPRASGSGRMPRASRKEHSPAGTLLLALRDAKQGAS